MIQEKSKSDASPQPGARSLRFESVSRRLGPNAHACQGSHEIWNPQRWCAEGQGGMTTNLYALKSMATPFSFWCTCCSANHSSLHRHCQNSFVYSGSPFKDWAFNISCDRKQLSTPSDTERQPVWCCASFSWPRVSSHPPGTETWWMLRPWCWLDSTDF